MPIIKEFIQTRSASCRRSRRGTGRIECVSAPGSRVAAVHRCSTLQVKVRGRQYLVVYESYLLTPGVAVV